MLIALFMFQCHPANCICIEFSKCGKYFATGSADSLVSIWDTQVHISYNWYNLYFFLSFLITRFRPFKTIWLVLTTAGKKVNIGPWPALHHKLITSLLQALNISSRRIYKNVVCILHNFNSFRRDRNF